MVRSSSSNSSLSVQPQQTLTETEREVLSLLSEHNLTNKQIAIRRQTTIRAVQKIIKILKEKGAFNIVRDKVRFYEPTSELANQSGKHRIRLHGQEWNIKIIWKDEIYNRIRNNANTIRIDNNTIRLYENSIEVYSAEGLSFFADDVHKATSRSLEYWDRFFTRLEHEFKIIIIKNRNQNIKLVNAHYSEVNNELGQEVEKKGIKLKIFANDDGKLWFLIDNSFKLEEAETVHPQKSEEDMEKVKSFFNDVRDKPHYELSEITELQNKNVLQTEYLLGFLDKAELDHQKTYGELLEILKINSSQINNIIQLMSKDLKKEQPQEESIKIKPYYVG